MENFSKKQVNLINKYLLGNIIGKIDSWGRGGGWNMKAEPPSSPDQ